MTSGEGTFVISNSLSLQYGLNVLLTNQTHYFCRFSNKETNKIPIIGTVSFATCISPQKSPKNWYFRFIFAQDKRNTWNTFKTANIIISIC